MNQGLPTREQERAIMPSKIAEFLTEMSKDPSMREAFEMDPDAAMADWGLSDKEKAALKSGDERAIRDCFDDDDPPGVVIILPI
jgi:hypothetical protein